MNKLSFEKIVPHLHAKPNSRAPHSPSHLDYIFAQTVSERSRFKFKFTPSREIFDGTERENVFGVAVDVAEASPMGSIDRC